MKTQRFIIMLFALTFALVPQSVRTASAERRGPKYSAELLSPRAEEVWRLDRLSAMHGLTSYTTLRAWAKTSPRLFALIFKDTYHGVLSFESIHIVAMPGKNLFHYLSRISDTRCTRFPLQLEVF